VTVRERIAVAPGIASVLDWMSSRSHREQLLLAAAATVATVAVMLITIWNPLIAYRQTSFSEVVEYDNVLARVRMADPDALSARKGQLAGDDETTVAGSAASHGLLISRIEPEGDYMRIAFEDADFMRILQWVSEMEGAGAGRAVAVEMERRPAPGLVNAQITLETRSQR
jgi:general secretion pathway protein M